MLADPTATEGDWLVALRQDNGRGRHGREWQSLDGNFTGSTLVVLAAGDPAAPALALAAGLALIEALEQVAPNAALSLKWPNDVMLGLAKLAGILLERSGDRVVAGFGVNLAVAPAIAGRATASLEAAITPQDFAPILADRFTRIMALWRSTDSAAFAKAWLARAHPVGTRISVHLNHDQRIAGRFDGIDPDGALRLCFDDGRIETIRAGDVSLA